MSDKLEITKVVQIMLENYRKVPINIVVPLSDIIVMSYNNKLLLSILCESDMYKYVMPLLNNLNNTYARVQIAVSSDPRMVHAGDMSDLGQFKLWFSLPNPMITVDKRSIMFTVTDNIEQLQQKICMVDRE